MATVLVTGGSGVLGRTTIPLLTAAGYEVRAPTRAALDLTDPVAVSARVQGVAVILHLATRIPPIASWHTPGAWDENDRLRAVATLVLVDAALAANVASFVFPSIALVYPATGFADEATPVAEVAPEFRSALAGESAVERFAASGRRGVVLRLGVLYGPGAAAERHADMPLRVNDAAIALVAALRVPSGTYNAVADGGRISNARLRAASDWRPAPD